MNALAHHLRETRRQLTTAYLHEACGTSPTREWVVYPWEEPLRFVPCVSPTEAWKVWRVAKPRQPSAAILPADVPLRAFDIEHVDLLRQEWRWASGPSHYVWMAEGDARPREALALAQFASRLINRIAAIVAVVDA